MQDNGVHGYIAVTVIVPGSTTGSEAVDEVGKDAALAIPLAVDSVAALHAQLVHQVDIRSWCCGGIMRKNTL